MSSIILIATGGTIASLPQNNGDVKASLQGEDLIHRLGIDQIKVQTLTSIGSFAFSFETLYEIGKAVQSALNDDSIDGIVITHGTDTMEETAFFLSLICERKKPIVLTGAQLDAGHPSSDGLQNLLDAIQVAGQSEVAALGPIIAFAGFLYTGREARKIDTHSLEAFGSPTWGPVGRIYRNTVNIGRQVRPYPILPLHVPDPVALIRLGLGITGQEIAKISEGYKGIVIEAYGIGNAHPSVYPVVSQFTELNIPVIITTRCLRGAVAPVYGGGGGRDLERAGAWFAGDLAGEKARLLLGLILSNGIKGQQAKNYVSEWAYS